MPLSRRPPTKVVVFQCPCGTGARHRSPRGARPRSRAILVEAPVSSMKTRRSGSSSGWRSNQSRRRRRTSGRCCSLACAVFFEGHAVAIQQTPHAARRNPAAVRRLQVGRDLGQGDVGALRDQTQDLLGQCLHPVRMTVAPAWSGLGVSLRPPATHPFDRRRSRNPESLRRRPAGLPALDRRYQTLAQIRGKGCRHRGWPPSPAPILNHTSLKMGIINDSI